MNTQDGGTRRFLSVAKFACPVASSAFPGRPAGSNRADQRQDDQRAGHKANPVRQDPIALARQSGRMAFPQEDRLQKRGPQIRVLWADQPRRLHDEKWQRTQGLHAPAPVRCVGRNRHTGMTAPVSGAGANSDAGLSAKPGLLPGPGGWHPNLRPQTGGAPANCAARRITPSRTATAAQPEGRRLAAGPGSRSPSRAGPEHSGCFCLPGLPPQGPRPADA